MIDAIDKATTQANGQFNQATQDIEGKAAAAIDDLQNQADELLDSLPTVPDPELIYRQKEAEILDKLAELERKQIELQEIGLDDIKERIRELIIPALPIPLKIPLISPKVLLAVILAKREKLLAELRKLKSKKNLKKGKKLFSYPLKPPTSLKLPSVPSLPKLPEVPDIPTLPSLPSVPKIPKIPSIDSLPKL
jgi:hypothetical protein